MKDGVYKNQTAQYWVKDGKVMMNLRGGFYKTTENFMLGADFVRDLNPGESTHFEESYNSCKSW